MRENYYAIKVVDAEKGASSTRFTTWESCLVLDLIEKRIAEAPEKPLKWTISE